MTPKEIAIENGRRRAVATEAYDPVSGRGAYGERVEVATPVEGLPTVLVPATMTADPAYSPRLDSR